MKNDKSQFVVRTSDLSFDRKSLPSWPHALCLGAFVVSAANPCSPPRHEDTKNRKDDLVAAMPLCVHLWFHIV